MTFDASAVDLSILSARAYNLRWAELPKGVIPLTAADPDFSIAPAVKNALQSYIDGGYLSYGPAEGFKEFKEAVANNYQLLNELKELQQHEAIEFWETPRMKLYLSTLKLQQGFV